MDKKQDVCGCGGSGKPQHEGDARWMADLSRQQIKEQEERESAGPFPQDGNRSDQIEMGQAMDPRGL
jgi:hypothetical protein